MKNLLVCCLLLFVSCNFHHQNDKRVGVNRDKGWKFIFNEKKKVIGLVGVNKDTIRTYFEYENNTGHNLFIDTITTSCGCTEVLYPRRLIHPKEKGKIQAIVHLTKDDSYIHKSIIVHFSDTCPVVLYIIGKRRSK